MLEDVTAPAPRFLLRFFLIEKLLRQIISKVRRFDSGAEIGPGLGDVSSFLLRSKWVNKIDLYEDSERAGEILANRFEAYNNVNVKSAFNGSEEGYDFILCCEVIEHIEDDRDFIQSISAALKKDGYFLGSVPCYMSKWQAVDELAGHFRRYEYNELHGKLAGAGFHVEIIECYGFPLINLLYPVRQFYYSSKLRKRGNQSKRDATAKSGISRGLAMLFNKRMVYIIARFFAGFQRLPFVSRWGDGFVFVCRKK